MGRRIQNNVITTTHLTGLSLYKSDKDIYKCPLSLYKKRKHRDLFSISMDYDFMNATLLDYHSMQRDEDGDTDYELEDYDENAAFISMGLSFTSRVHGAMRGLSNIPFASRRLTLLPLHGNIKGTIRAKEYFVYLRYANENAE